MRLRNSAPELGVRSNFTSRPSFANRPRSCATQTGRLLAPPKPTMSSLVWAAAGATSAAARNTAKDRRLMGCPLFDRQGLLFRRARNGVQIAEPAERRPAPDLDGGAQASPLAQGADPEEVV